MLVKSLRPRTEKRVVSLFLALANDRFSCATVAFGEAVYTYLNVPDSLNCTAEVGRTNTYNHNNRAAWE